MYMLKETTINMHCQNTHYVTMNYKLGLTETNCK